MNGEVLKGLYEEVIPLIRLPLRFERHFDDQGIDVVSTRINLLTVCLLR